MMRRGIGPRRGRGLIGTVATTAVVAGTATVTSNAINSRAQQKAQEKAQNEANQQYVDQQMAAQQATPVAVGAGGGPTIDMTTELKKLADLKAAGALTDEEFAAAKAKLLA
jgi:hypothetical protein